MHLSTNRKYHSARVVYGFTQVEFDTLSEFKTIVVFDHAPAKFKDGIRNKANVETLDCLILDVDNVEGEEITIVDFIEMFKKYEMLIYTSRNHQKIKELGGGKFAEARDRFHVVFPIGKDVTSTEYEIIAKSFVERFDFFDKACVDSSRFFFGNKEAEVFRNNGEFIEIPEDQKEDFEPDFVPFHVFENDYTQYNQNCREKIRPRRSWLSNRNQRSGSRSIDSCRCRF